MGEDVMVIRDVTSGVTRREVATGGAKAIQWGFWIEVVLLLIPRPLKITVAPT